MMMFGHGSGECDDTECGPHGHGRGQGHGQGHGHGRRQGQGQGRGQGHGFGHGPILGTTTLGERGQVVIPAEARKTLAVEAGDKFVVFGDKRGNSVTLVKADVISQFANVFLEKSDKFGKIAQSILGQINDTDEDGDGGEGSDEGGNGDEDDKADDAESDFPAGDAAGTGNAGIGTSTDAATNQ